MGFSLTFTPSTINLADFPDFPDTSTPPQPVLNTYVRTSNTGGVYEYFDGGLVDDGGAPVLADGTNLPTHGIFGPGTVWYEYSLGDFSLTDSPSGDFIGSFPTEVFPGTGQINVYEVSAVGYSGATLHFDLYDTVVSKNRSVFAPFSHDADAEANIIPEPASYLVWLLIGLTWAGSAWVYQYRSRWRQRERNRVALAADQGSLNLRA